MNVHIFVRRVTLPIAVMFCTLALWLATPTSAHAQALTCDVDGASPCVFEEVTHLYELNVQLSRTTGFPFVPWTIQVDNTTSTGTLPADPDLVVARLDAGTGRWWVVAYDDDSLNAGQDNNPRVQFGVMTTGTYRIWVTTRNQNASGTGRLRVFRAGSADLINGPIMFGSGSRQIDFRDGDTLLATKARASDTTAPVTSPYADTRLLLLDREPVGNCQSGSCGWAWYNDDDVQTLSRVDPDTDGFGVGVAYVGTRGARDEMHARVYHLRRHVDDGGGWTHDNARDLDNDSLPAELELELGTCDRVVGGGDLEVKVGTRSCRDMRNLVNQGQTCSGGDRLMPGDDPTCWTPWDSDHDGLGDLDEIYGSRRCYDLDPATNALGYIGPCINLDGDRHCDHDCSGAFAPYEVAWSALDSTLDPVDRWRPVEPTVFDFLIDTMYSVSPDTTQGQGAALDQPLSDLAIRQLYYTLEEEPSECNDCAPSACTYCSAARPSMCVFGNCCDDPGSDCPNDDRYTPRVHIFETPYVVPHDYVSPQQLMNSDGFLSDLGGTITAAARFNFSYDAQRRYSPGFRFLSLTEAGGGQGEFFSRIAVGGTDGAGGGKAVFIHELGHTLGLAHNGDGLDGAGKPHNEPYYVNYPSLMSCRGAAMASKTRAIQDGFWDGRPPACNGQGVCAFDDFFSCTVGNDESGQPLNRCLPDYYADNIVWPIRFSRGVLGSFDVDELATGGVQETGLAPSYYLHHMVPSYDAGGCPTHANPGAHDLYRMRRFEAPNGTSRGQCSGGVCSLDFSRDGNFGFFSQPVDANDNGVIDAFRDGNNNVIDNLVQDDHDDWGLIIRRSLRPFRESPNQTYYRGSMLFATGFNAPAHLYDAQTGTCGVMCQAAVGVDNLVESGVQSVLGADASLDDSPFNGSYGHWARFRGNGTDSHITLTGDALEAMGPDPAYPSYGGFEFRSWVQIDSTTTQDFHPLVFNGLFFIAINTLLDYALVGVAETKNADGTVTFKGHFFFNLDWAPGEQRWVQLRYLAGAGSLELNVSTPVGAGDRDARIGATSAYRSTASQTVVDTWGVGDVVLGAAGTDSLHGWMDDVAFYSWRP